MTFSPGRQPLRPPRHAQREVRAVDGDQRVRRRRRHRVAGLADAPEQVRQPRQHLGDAHHRELLHRKAAGEPLRRHRRAADALRATRPSPTSCAQPGDQRAAEGVAGELARDQEEPHAHGARAPRGRGRRRRPRPRSRRSRGSSRPPASTATPARPGRGGAPTVDGADRRQVEAAVLAGLRRLVEHAAAPAGPEAGAGARHEVEQRVGALDRLEAEADAARRPPPPARRRPTPSAATIAAARAASARSASEGATRPRTPARRHEVGQDLVRRPHA